MKIYSYAFFQECKNFRSYIQISDLSKLTSVYSMRWGNSVFDELVITGGDAFQKRQIKGERSKYLSCFSSTIDTTNNQIVAKGKFLFKRIPAQEWENWTMIILHPLMN